MARREKRAPYRGPGRTSHALATLLVLLLLGAALAADHQSWGPRYLGWDAAPGSSDGTGPSDGTGSSDGTEPNDETGLALAEPPAPVEVAAPLEPGRLDPASVRAAVRGLRDPALGPHVLAAVADLTGGEPVLAGGAGQVVPASTTKLLTGTAALSELGAETRFSTRVVAGAKPGQVLLVGGGDPYLASEPASGSTYPERADVVTLAALTAEALTADSPAGDSPAGDSSAGDNPDGQPGPKVRLRYDTSLFTGPSDNPRWRDDYVRDGIVSPIVPLWVDSGRDASGWGRVDDPARAAADAFAAALRAAGVRVVGAPRPAVADPAAEELAAVESAPLGQIVGHMLDVSDNETAEVLAHHVGLATSGVGSFEAGAAGTLGTLAGLGVDTSGDRVYDGSGLSRQNLVSPQTLLEVIRVAASDQHPELRGVVEGLPVAGFTGSLASRFTTGDPEGRGRVRAKTGTLTGVHSLAGLVADMDGNLMAFVLAADRVAAEASLDARDALDEVAASLAACSCGAPSSGSGG